MDKFKNKYKIGSFRLKNWDYGTNGIYFITICTQNRVHFFGEIHEGKLQETPLGDLANALWYDIPKHFPYIQLGNFVVMPNHIHGILIVDKGYTGAEDTVDTVKTRLIASPQESQQHQSPQEDPQDRSPQDNQQDNPKKPPPGGITGEKNPMLQDNISRVIRWYKGRCTFEMRKILPTFEWQSLFYDHIVRDERAFINISYYIENNPAKWQEDTFAKKQ